MLRAFLQTLTDTTKGDVMGKEAILRLGLTQGAPLSPVLFIVYTNNLTQFCTRPIDSRLKTREIGKADLTLTAHDVVLQATNWGY